MWQSSDFPQCPLSCSLIYLLIFIILHFLMCFIPKGLGLLFNFPCPVISLSQLPLACLAPLLMACWSQVQQGSGFMVTLGLLGWLLHHQDTSLSQSSCQNPSEVLCATPSFLVRVDFFPSVLCSIWAYIWHSSQDHLSQAVSVSVLTDTWAVKSWSWWRSSFCKQATAALLLTEQRT